MDIEFATAYTKNTAEYKCNPGHPTLQEYEYKFDKEGHKQLIKKDSVKNVYEEIQADRDSCDINKLMERFTLGDKEALYKQPAYYIDTRDMPKTFMEVFERGLEAEQFFYEQPKELRELFDNSYSVFYTEMGTEEFNKKIEKYNERFIDHTYDSKEEPVEGGVTYNGQL